MSDEPPLMEPPAPPKRGITSKLRASSAIPPPPTDVISPAVPTNVREHSKGKRPRSNGTYTSEEKNTTNPIPSQQLVSAEVAQPPAQPPSDSPQAVPEEAISPTFRQKVSPFAGVEWRKGARGSLRRTESGSVTGSAGGELIRNLRSSDEGASPAKNAYQPDEITPAPISTLALSSATITPARRGTHARRRTRSDARRPIEADIPEESSTVNLNAADDSRNRTEADGSPQIKTVFSDTVGIVLPEINPIDPETADVYSSSTTSQPDTLQQKRNMFYHSDFRRSDSYSKSNRKRQSVFKPTNPSLLPRAPFLPQILALLVKLLARPNSISLLVLAVVAPTITFIISVLIHSSIGDDAQLARRQAKMQSLFAGPTNLTLNDNTVVYYAPNDTYHSTVMDRLYQITGAKVTAFPSATDMSRAIMDRLPGLIKSDFGAVAFTGTEKNPTFNIWADLRVSQFPDTMNLDRGPWRARIPMLREAVWTSIPYLYTTPAALQLAVESAIISVTTGSNSKLMDVRIDWLLPANGSNASYVADDSFGPGKRAVDGTPLPPSGFDRTRSSEIYDISVFGLRVLSAIGFIPLFAVGLYGGVSEAGGGLLLTLRRMGLHEASYLLSNMVFLLILDVIASALLSIAFAVVQAVGAWSFLGSVHWTIILVQSLLYGAAMAAYGLLCAVSVDTGGYFVANSIVGVGVFGIVLVDIALFLSQNNAVFLSAYTALGHVLLAVATPWVEHSKIWSDIIDLTVPSAFNNGTAPFSSGITLSSTPFWNLQYSHTRVSSVIASNSSRASAIEGLTPPVVSLLTLLGSTAGLLFLAWSIAVLRHNPRFFLYRGYDAAFKSRMRSEQAQSQMASSIRLVGATKRYPGLKQDALKNVTVTMDLGSVWAITGRNGAGKSTLMNILAGVFPPTNGNCFIFGYDVARDWDRLRVATGYCPQSDTLYQELTAFEHIAFYAVFRGVNIRRALQILANTPDISIPGFGKNSSYKRVQPDFRGAAARALNNSGTLWKSLRGYADALLAQVDLQDQADTKVADMSTGIRRRLSLILATVMEVEEGAPSLILLDEPTQNMDPVSRSLCWEIMNLKSNRIWIVTTHDMTEAAALAHHVAIFEDGEVKASGTPVDLTHKYGLGYQLSMSLKGSTLKSHAFWLSKWIRAFVPQCEVVSVAGSVLTVGIPRAASTQLAATLRALRADHGLIEWTLSSSTLEEVFLNLCGDEVTRTAKSETVDIGDEVYTCAICQRRPATNVLATHLYWSTSVLSQRAPTRPLKSCASCLTRIATDFVEERESADSVDLLTEEENPMDTADGILKTVPAFSDYSEAYNIWSLETNQADRSSRTLLASRSKVGQNSAVSIFFRRLKAILWKNALVHHRSVYVNALNIFILLVAGSFLGLGHMYFETTVSLERKPGSSCGTYFVQVNNDIDVTNEQGTGGSCNATNLANYMLAAPSNSTGSVVVGYGPACFPNSDRGCLSSRFASMSSDLFSVRAWSSPNSNPTIPSSVSDQLLAKFLKGTSASRLVVWYGDAGNQSVSVRQLLDQSSLFAANAVNFNDSRRLTRRKAMQSFGWRLNNNDIRDSASILVDQLASDTQPANPDTIVLSDLDTNPPLFQLRSSGTERNVRTVFLETQSAARLIRSTLADRCVNTKIGSIPFTTVEYNTVLMPRTALQYQNATALASAFGSMYPDLGLQFRRIELNASSDVAYDVLFYPPYRSRFAASGGFGPYVKLFDIAENPNATAANLTQLLQLSSRQSCFALSPADDVDDSDGSGESQSLYTIIHGLSNAVYKRLKGNDDLIRSQIAQLPEFGVVGMRGMTVADISGMVVVLILVMMLTSGLFPKLVDIIQQDLSTGMFGLMRRNGLDVLSYWIANYLYALVWCISLATVALILVFAASTPYFRSLATYGPGYIVSVCFAFYLWAHAQSCLVIFVACLFNSAAPSSFVSVTAFLFFSLITPLLIWGADPTVGALPVASSLVPSLGFVSMLSLLFKNTTFPVGERLGDFSSGGWEVDFVSHALLQFLSANLLALLGIWIQHLRSTNVSLGALSVLKQKPSLEWMEVNAGTDSDIAVEERRIIETLARGGSIHTALTMLHVSKVFGDKHGKFSGDGVRDISVSNKYGETLALLGRNRSGKTLILNLIAGLVRPTAGELKKSTDSIGLCSQDEAFWRLLTVEEHLRIFFLISGGGDTAGLQRQNSPRSLRRRSQTDDLKGTEGIIHECARQVGIDGPLFRTSVKYMSPGLRRRLAIGLSLVSQPRILLLDNASNGLDPLVRRQIWSVLENIKQTPDRSVVIATNSPAEADALSSRIGTGGRLRSLGSPIYLKNKWGEGVKLTVRFPIKLQLPDNGTSEREEYNHLLRFMQWAETKRCIGVFEGMTAEFGPNIEIDYVSDTDLHGVLVNRGLYTHRNPKRESKSLDWGDQMMDHNPDVVSFSVTMRLNLPLTQHDMPRVVNKIESLCSDLGIEQWDLRMSTLDDVFAAVVSDKVIA
ncbi:hypothetical protein BJ742DRAFT_769685 [Cladochytrium replicatum]|nr:hypothetical protein BJ742DRAFT_769685 [Cladochytrium replicatum]